MSRPLTVLLASGAALAAACRSAPSTPAAPDAPNASGGPPAAAAPAAALARWPADAAPERVGRLVAANWAARRFDFETNPRRAYVIYPEVVAWSGALAVADLAGDAGLRARLVHKFDTLRTPAGARRVGPDAHVDYRVFGAVPLEIARLTGDMAALLRHQAPGGLWRQLVDRPESWEETSGSGMFAFAVVTRVRNGWLDAATYGPGARRAWLALVREVDAGGNVRGVCVGTYKASREVGPDTAAQHRFYLARARRTGDLHGQAPVLWTAAALMR